MKQLLKKIHIWWLNVQITATKYEMCNFYGNGDLYRAHCAKTRFYALITKRNALEVQL